MKKPTGKPQKPVWRPKGPRKPKPAKSALAALERARKAGVFT